MMKKNLIFGAVLMMCLGIFTSCGADSDRKIDIGGDIVAEKIPADVQTRVMVEKDIFSFEDKIIIEVGFGLLPGINSGELEDQAAFIMLKISSSSNAYVIFDVIKESTDEEYIQIVEPLTIKSSTLKWKNSIFT